MGFRCNARDTAQAPKLGFHAIESFVDHGPKITVTAPEPDSAHALIGAVRFEFKVEPDPVADDDEEAELGSRSSRRERCQHPPRLSGGRDLHGVRELRGSGSVRGHPQRRRARDHRAENQRTPVPAERLHKYEFVIDGEGPVIAIQTPRNEQVVGGQVQLKFSVSDAAVRRGLRIRGDRAQRAREPLR